MLVDVSERAPATTILGEPVVVPLVARADRAVAACSTATARFSPAAPRSAAGIPFTLSTMSICSIEDVAGAVDKPFWFQLYVMKDSGFIRALIERAAAANAARWC